jgi:S1/P1 Nuclease
MLADGWVKESNTAARQFGFKNIEVGGKPSKDYIDNAQETASKRLAFAGYRLAELMNRLYGKP